MKRFSIRLQAVALAAVTMLAGAEFAPAADVFAIDPAHSAVTFRIRHLISKVSGRFNDLTGAITGDPKNPAGASIELTIKAASVDTQIPKRDDHLRSADFFDVAKFPDMTFKSSKITPKGGDSYDVTGTFTMHGVSKEIVVPVTFNGVAKDPWGSERAGFDASFALNRKDYGIVYNSMLDTGGMMLGDDVEVIIGIEAVKKTPEPAKN